MNKELLRKMLDEEYVMVQKHPTLDLYVYNYTRKCQFEKNWNEITLLTRGLILDGDMNIVGRGFGKFFNLQEHKDEDIPKLPYEIFEKMDGSLGIVFIYKNQLIVASRGSFISDQAIIAKNILDKKYGHILSFPSNTTYLFEIVHKNNRIVVNYGDEENLVLLSIINNLTGEEYPLEDIGFPIVKKYGNEEFERYKLNQQTKKSL